MAKKDKKPRAEVIKDIEEMFKEAGNIFRKDKGKANDLVRKARNLAMKSRLKMPSRLQKNFCKHCYSFLKPGINCRIRLQRGKAIYYCLECKKYMRFPYK
ncbi:MAG: ribonuclease P [Candidatus Woesearchaeota archaeon]|nr:ribonuclease P [Candidatus Woesearchaeota archaeon]